MIELVQKHLPEIRALCQQYKMQRVWLFGSARNAHLFTETSDVDFLYVPDKSRMSVREFLDNPYLIQRQISELLKRKVDWVRYLPFRNPYFRAEVEATKQLIYEY